MSIPPGNLNANTCAATPESAAPEAEKLSWWWWSRDEERYYGPCASRADAIMEAWADDPDRTAHVLEAACSKWRTDIICGDLLSEAFDDANDEQADPDGDPPSAMFDDWNKLAERLNRIVHVAIRDKGITAWKFAQQRNGEWVNIPAMWALADAPVEASPPSSERESSRDESSLLVFCMMGEGE